MACHQPNRRTFLKTGAAGLAAGLAGCISGGGGGPDQLKVGLIAPLSGPFSLAALEMDIGAKFAQSDVNDGGGVFGEDMELIVKDNQSNPETAAQVARELVEQEEVHGVVGTVSSGSRNAAFDIVTSEMPFMYPVQYEGGVCHENFFGLGPVPNQTVANAVPYMMDRFGSDVYFVGSDFAFPRALLPIIRDIVTSNGGNIVGEGFAPIGTTEWGSVINNVESADPDFIYGPIPGGSGTAFLGQMFNRGLLQDTPLISMTFDEGEVSSMDPEVASAGLFSALDYFMTLDNAENQEYVSRYREQNGQDSVTFSISVNTYSGVRLLASAANEANSVDPEDIVSAIEEVEVATPKGDVSISSENHGIVTDFRVGQVTQDSYPSFEVQRTWEQTEPEIEGCNL